MAHMRKGQLAPAPSLAAWRRHLRDGKRAFWKMERVAARGEMGDQLMTAEFRSLREEPTTD